MDTLVNIIYKLLFIITVVNNDLSDKIIVISASQTWSGNAVSYNGPELLAALQNGYKLINVVNNYGVSSTTVYGQSYLLPVFRVPNSKEGITVVDSDGATYNQVILLDFVFLKI